MKKTILAASIALSLAMGAGVGIAQADVINNDIVQGAVFNTQGNLLIEIVALSGGPTVVAQTNVVNSANLAIGVANDDAFGNDVAQFSLINNQSNALLTIVGINIGSVDIDQVNAVNIAKTDIVALDDAVGNDVTQIALISVQGNIVAVARIVQAGASFDLDQVNAVNSADVRVIGSQVLGGNIEAVLANDTFQFAAGIQQGNIVIGLEGLQLGPMTISQTNAVNIAKGVYEGELVASNDTTQLAFGIQQGNATGLLQLGSLGDLTIKQTNAVNSADVEIKLDVLGGNPVQAVIDNDVTQVATSIDQDNVSVTIEGITVGATVIEQVNAVNIAKTDITGSGQAGNGIIGNDVTQIAIGGAGHIDQDNQAFVGAVINVGSLALTQTNVVNSADITLRSSTITFGNDLTQLASGVTQSNLAAVAGGVSVGPMTISQVNAINVGSVSIINP